LLASCRDGCTEAIMLAHGFTIPQMVELVRGWPPRRRSATAVGKAMEIATLRITEAGRRVLAGMRPR
jgi:hypothetical protein